VLGVAAFLLFGVATCLGLGLGTIRLFLRDNDGTLTCGDAGLAGLAALAALAATANLFFALAPWPALAASLAGAALLVVERRRLRRLCSTEWVSPAAPLMLLAAFLLAMLPAVMRSAAWHYDTGLYHLQHVRQAMEMPVVLGMAAIHERFGYNSLWFTTAAMLGGGFADLRGPFLVNALLAGFVVIAMAERVLGAARAGKGRTAVFGAVSLALAVLTPVFALRAWIGSPNTDLPAILLALYAFHLALQYSDLDGDRDAIAWLLAVCIALAITAKISGAPLILLLALPLADWWRGRLGGRAVGVLVASGLSLAVPWILRGIATSGCIAYPEPGTCLPLPWTIDPAVARHDLNWMRAWARQPGVSPDVVLSDRAWLRPWLQAALAERVLPYVAGLAALLVALAAASKTVPRFGSVWSGLDRTRRRESLAILAISLVALSFWFVTAPLIRYGKVFVILPLLLGACLLAPAVALGWLRACTPRVGLRAPLATVAALVLLAQVVVWPPRGEPFGLGGFPRLPEVKVRPIGTFALLPILQPTDGQQCWDAPRLCTPALHRDIAVSRLGPWLVVRSRSGQDAAR
jgi:hypothetical protein